MKLDWHDARTIGEELYEAHQDLDPLTLSFVRLHELICALPDFVGDPKASTEKHLEAIQMIWLEEWKVDHE
jgi:FeS assembly protein IscX